MPWLDPPTQLDRRPCRSRYTPVGCLRGSPAGNLGDDVASAHGSVAADAALAPLFTRPTVTVIMPSATRRSSSRAASARCSRRTIRRADAGAGGRRHVRRPHPRRRRASSPRRPHTRGQDRRQPGTGRAHRLQRRAVPRAGRGRSCGSTATRSSRRTTCASASSPSPRPGADNVGGRMDAEGSGPVAEAIALATSSPFGVGNAQFHYATGEHWVDTVYLGAWPRDGVRAGRPVRSGDGAQPGRRVQLPAGRGGGRILLTTASAPGTTAAPRCGRCSGSTASTGCGRSACCRSTRDRCARASSCHRRSSRPSSAALSSPR